MNPKPLRKWYSLLFLSVLMFIIVVTGPVVSTAQGPGEHTLHLFREEHKFLGFYVVSAEPAPLNGLQFITVGDSVQPEADFGAFFHTQGVAQTGSCYVYRYDAQCPLPQDCLNMIIHQIELARDDVFWYDFEKSRPLEIAIWQNGVFTGLVWPDISWNFTYQVPTPTPTLTFTPTPTSTPTPTFTPTPTPTPTPTDTPTPTPTPTDTPSLPPFTTSSTTPGEAVAVVRVSSAYLRRGPGICYDIVGFASGGRELPIVSQARGWFVVQYEGREVWIASSVVVVRPEDARIPPAATIPALTLVCTPGWDWPPCETHGCAFDHSALCNECGTGWTCVWNPARCPFPTPSATPRGR